jgi:hypothetical protein
LQRENQAHKELTELKEKIKLLTAQLIALLSEQLKTLQSEINTRMEQINSCIYNASKIPPILALSENGKSYTFETPKDKGTGAQYKGLLVFDLSVLELTALPLLVHDSVLFKHIADEPLEKIFERYTQSEKQIFVTIDKESSYTPKMRDILKATTVLELSDNGNELFGRPWNVKDESAENIDTRGE